MGRDHQAKQKARSTSPPPPCSCWHPCNQLKIQRKNTERRRNQCSIFPHLPHSDHEHAHEGRRRGSAEHRGGQELFRNPRGSAFTRERPEEPTKRVPPVPRSSRGPGIAVPPPASSQARRSNVAMLAQTLPRVSPKKKNPTATHGGREFDGLEGR